MRVRDLLRSGSDRVYEQLWRVRLGLQRGQGLVEYALILVLVAVAVVVALNALGGRLQGVFQGISDKLTVKS